MIKRLLTLMFATQLGAAVQDAQSMGCVQVSTVTVEMETCQVRECVQRGANGNCSQWECTSTLKKKYVDPAGTGCTRQVNCGENMIFILGQAEEPETESFDICDWRACMEADSKTGECYEYDCLSRRTFTTERVNYSKSYCIRDPYAPQIPSKNVKQRSTNKQKDQLQSANVKQPAETLRGVRPIQKNYNEL
jgi:hypothetical protein